MPFYLAKEFFHKGLGPAAVDRPLLGWMADVSSMEQKRQGFGLVNPGWEKCQGKAK
jgi:hypothetical protein